MDHFFSENGPVAELENYFINARERLAIHRTDLKSKNKTGVRKYEENSGDGHVLDNVQGISDQDGAKIKTKGEEAKKIGEQDVRLKLSIVETEPEESLSHTHQDSASAEGLRGQSSLQGK